MSEENTIENLDDMVEQIIFEKPEPSGFADDIIKEAESGTEEPEESETQTDTSETVSVDAEFAKSYPGVWKDNNGETFDPEIHATDDEGKPKYTKTGKFAKKRGRKNASVSFTTDENLLKAKNAAVATVATIFTIGQAIGGDEWRPIVDPQTGVNEPENLTEAWTQYYYATGVKEMPPWLGVLIATGAYALPRCSMPKTQSRLKRFSDWLKVRVLYPIKTMVFRRKK